MLMQPNIKLPPTDFGWNGEGNSKEGPPLSGDQIVNERTKYMGQQFMARPFGEDEPWHICATCEVFVPPRTWHCNDCNTCVFRRDHHCIFAMACIGEENHCNFLGLLLYLGCGTTTYTILNFIYVVYFTDTVWWMYLIKSFVPFYVLIFDFSISNMLSGVNLIGQGAAWFIFLYYLLLASKGQTSADKARGVGRSSAGMGIYDNLKAMLGPNPLINVVWPFHEKMKLSYGQQQPQGDLRKGL
jgi:hypothetical protein